MNQPPRSPHNHPINLNVSRSQHPNQIFPFPFVMEPPHFDHFLNGVEAFNILNSSPNRFSCCYGVSSVPHGSSKVPNDRIVMKAKYCGVTLEWLFMFNIKNHKQPPDIIAPLELEHLFHSALELKSLCHWEYSDHNSLLNLCRELMIQTKSHHVSQIEQFGSEQAKIDLQVTAGYPNTLFMYKNEKDYVVEVLLSFKFEFKGKSEHFTGKISLERKGKRTNSGVLLYTGKNAALLDPCKDMIPKCSSSTTALEYVEQVKTTVQNYCTNCGKRVELFNHLRTILGDPTEYDNITYLKFSFIAFNHQIPYVFLCVLQPNFPSEPPKLNIISIFETKDGLPIVVRHKKKYMVYTPTSPLGHMARLMGDAIRKMILELQAISE